MTGHGIEKVDVGVMASCQLPLRIAPASLLVSEGNLSLKPGSTNI